jgi:branched-chain amino acid aminotransferase
MPTAYFDGRFLEPNDIAISPADFGFSRGVAVYELTRVYGGVPFRLEDHLERLMQGADILGISCPLPPQEITGVVKRVITANRYAQSIVKFYLTAGESGHAAGFGFSANRNFTPHLMIIEEEVRSLHPEAPKGLELYRCGLNLKRVSFSREIPAIKSTNYASGFSVSREMAGSDCDEILLTHRDGYVTETPTANFFCVIDDTLCTPKRGMLYGITRKTLLELAADTGIDVKECDLTQEDIRRATEAFVTGSFVEMVPVRKIDDAIFATTVEGPVYKSLRTAFTAHIAEYCAPEAKAA